MSRVMIVCALLALLTNSGVAEDCCKREGVVFHCRTPGDILKGTGCYIFDTGTRVLHGAGTIVTAPFKAKFCIPERRRYIYRPGRWTPPTLKPYPRTTNPRLPESTLGPPEPPKYDVPSPPKGPQKVKPMFFQPLYYPSKDNTKIVVANVGGFRVNN